MISRVDAHTVPILEIGAGTGAITAALLERSLGPDRLFVIERDPELAAFLRCRFPRVRVRCADAMDTQRILYEEGISTVNTIISSLPLRNLSRADRLGNIDAMLASLAYNGQLIQYTYRRDCPISPVRFGLQAECLGRVWHNLPPAAVWRFTRKRC